jgi:hypothetical protein
MCGLVVCADALVFAYLISLLDTKLSKQAKPYAPQSEKNAKTSTL